MVHRGRTLEWIDRGVSGMESGDRSKSALDEKDVNVDVTSRTRS